MNSVVVVGGGVIGLSAGLALARSGCQVTVLDYDPHRSGASWGNAGHIATEQVSPLASIALIKGAWRRRFAAGGALHLPLGMMRAWLPFAVRLLAASAPRRFDEGRLALRGLLAEALPAWRRLVAELGLPELLREDGHLLAWESATSAAAGEAAWRAADTGTARLEAVKPDDIRHLDEIMGTPSAGVARFAGTAQISDLHELAEALEQGLLRRGGKIQRATARVVVKDGRAHVPEFPADLVLIAAGVRSAALVESAGHRAPLIAERGYHIRAAAGRWPCDLPPVVFEDRSMIVTRYGDTVQAASFVEFGSINGPPDPRKWERLERHVRELGLPLAPPFTRWVGARPTLPDYLPAIGRSRRARNLLYAFGHQHLGLTLAAVTAEAIAALATGVTPAVPLNAFNLDRFGGR